MGVPAFDKRTDHIKPDLGFGINQEQGILIRHSRTLEVSDKNVLITLFDLAKAFDYGINIKDCLW